MQVITQFWSSLIVRFRLRRLGTPGLWDRRERYRQAKIRRSHRRQSRSSRREGQRRNISAAAQLASQTKGLALTALLLLVSTEVFGYELSKVTWPVLHRGPLLVNLQSKWNPFEFFSVAVDSQQYGSLAATAVGAEATFLALFYATVGVVASTAYSAVPGDIRQLFVDSRISLSGCEAASSSWITVQTVISTLIEIEGYDWPHEEATVQAGRAAGQCE
jgi:hypothetical protein